MRRFFATFGFSFVLSLLLLNNIFSERAVIYFAVSLCLFSVTLIFAKNSILKELSCIFLAFALSGALFFAYTSFVYQPQLRLAGEKFNITATVLDYPSISSGGNYSYLIKTESVGGENKKIRMRLYTPYDICAEPYDKIEFSSRLFAVGENETGVLRYFKGKRTFLAAYTKLDVFVHNCEKKPAISFFFLQKGKSEKRLRKYLDGDYAEFAVSVLFGDKAFLSAERKDEFYTVGLSHIMAVSGLHMSVWIFGIYAVLRKLHLEKRICALLCIISCWCLVIFCAFSVSVIRASVMLTVFYSASFFKRRSDSLNCLGLAAFIICAFNPFAVCDMSFLLSFFATLGIIVFSRCLNLSAKINNSKTLKNKLSSYAFSCAVICVSANIFTVPVLLKYFSSLSTWAVLANISVSFAIEPCLILSGLLSVCPNIKGLIYPIKALLYITEKFIFTAVDLIYSLPFSMIFADSLTTKLVFSYALIVGVYAFYLVKSKRFSLTSLVPVLCAVIITTA